MIRLSGLKENLVDTWVMQRLSRLWTAAFSTCFPTSLEKKIWGTRTHFILAYFQINILFSLTDFQTGLLRKQTFSVSGSSFWSAWSKHMTRINQLWPLMRTLWVHIPFKMCLRGNVSASMGKKKKCFAHCPDCCTHKTLPQTTFLKYDQRKWNPHFI